MELSTIKAALNNKEATYLQQLLSDPIKRMTEHSDVELTEDEIAEALIKAKVAKVTRMKYEENELLRRKKSNELVLPFNNEQLISYCENFFMERFGYAFEFDSENRSVIEHLSYYFTNDERFEVANRSLKKGILLQGNVGIGKTLLMKFFQKNKKRCYTVKSCSVIADEFLLYSKDDELTIEDTYSTPIEKPLHDPGAFFQKYIGYCFDDLGTEELKNNFGNKKNVMADIIMAVYNKKDYEKFHITTNLTAVEIEQRYGTRVRSRIREMFNIIVLGGKDRRK